MGFKLRLNLKLFGRKKNSRNDANAKPTPQPDSNPASRAAAASKSTTDAGIKTIQGTGNTPGRVTAPDPVVVPDPVIQIIEKRDLWSSALEELRTKEPKLVGVVFFI